MANTPLELYENAYNCHYHQKKISEAIKIYESIIREFPDSNECAYAVIQLQKIKASDITKALKKAPSGVMPLLIAAFLSSLIALLVAIAGVLLLFRELRTEQERTSLAIAALSKLYCNDETNALKIIESIKALSRRDPLPFELTSDIYRKHDKETQGDPLSPPPAAPSVNPEPEPAQPVVAPKPVPPVPAPNTNRTPGIAPAKRPAPAKKNPLIVNPDSVSYF